MGANVSTSAIVNSNCTKIETHVVDTENVINGHFRKGSKELSRRSESRHSRRRMRNGSTIDGVDRTETKRRRHPQQRRDNKYSKSKAKMPRSETGRPNEKKNRPWESPNEKERVHLNSRTETNRRKKKTHNSLTYLDLENNIIETLQNSLLQENKNKKSTRDFRENNNKKLKESRQKQNENQTQKERLYDLTVGSNCDKIYDLRTLYSTIDQPAAQADDQTNPTSSSDHINNSQLSSTYINNSDPTNHVSQIANTSEENKPPMIKRAINRSSSLRRDNDAKKPSSSRFSLRLLGRRSFDGATKSLPINRTNKKASSTHVLAESYLDPAFMQSEVSFHVQGRPKRTGHVVLASPSTLSFDASMKFDQCNKENERPNFSARNVSILKHGSLNRPLKFSNNVTTCETILEEADMNLEEKKVTIIEKGGASANAEMCSSGVTPVYLAAQEGHLQVLQELVAAGGKVDHPAADGLTPVHAAAQMGCTDVLKYMLSLDPRLVHIRDADGATPLHFSASRGHLQAGRLLLSSGANPDHADLWGKTPLHDALENRHQEMARLLMQHSVSQNASEQHELDTRHSSSCSSNNSSSCSRKSSNNRNADSNTRRKRGGRNHNSTVASHSPFYLHPPEDANDVTSTSPPSPCSHHTVMADVEPSSQANEFVNETDPQDLRRVRQLTRSKSSESPFQSKKGDRSTSRNSNESQNNTGESSLSQGGSTRSSSVGSSSMLQDLRDIATQQQLLLEKQTAADGELESEPFYLHSADSADSNSSPIQKLFSSTNSKKSNSNSSTINSRSSMKSNTSLNHAEASDKVLKHLQSLDDLVTGVPPPDYAIDEPEEPMTSHTPLHLPRSQHSALVKTRSEPASTSKFRTENAQAELSSSHDPAAVVPSPPTGPIPPPPPPPPPPSLVPLPEKLSNGVDTSADAAAPRSVSSPEIDHTDKSVNGWSNQSKTVIKEEVTELNEKTEEGISAVSLAPASRGLASISIAQLQSVQLRKTQTKELLKTTSVPLQHEIEKPDQADVIAELKKSVDIGSPSKLKHQQHVQQQQQVIENMQLLITPEQIMCKVPQVDSAGLPIPEWKRQMLARRAAERATAEEQQMRLQQLEMKRLQQLPPWKRQLLEKRNSSSSTSSGPSSMYMPKVMEPRKISVALTASR